jgi:adenine-specific DNA-methyltransferase
MDFFGGSGTTAHAVMDMNKSGGERKYLLVETNTYFQTTIIPRVKKVAYTNTWSSGRAVDGGQGISHFCKYFTLEQYEDALRRAVYVDDSKGAAPEMFDNPYETPFSTYVFLRDLKMSDALHIDYDANKVRVNFSKLYDDIDWAETLSCIKGKFIKSQTADSVTLTDGKSRESLETIKFDEINYNDILPLVWWDK